tara:strand:- start:6703 stop:7941 length:1239 start_codon:yes stop_codon:yes gene_type:complete
MNIKDKVRSVILSRTKHKKNRMVGIEVESILHTSDNKRLPVNKGTHLSAVDLINILNKKNGDNGICSLEPGGQLEWSSPPFNDLNDLQEAMEEHYCLLDTVLLDHKLKLVDYGLDPIYAPKEVELIDQKKYHLMDKNMAENGKMGKWMMRNTASIQVNLDTIDAIDMEEMVFVADCIHPVASYLFANCPYKESKKNGMKNIRNIIWEETDRSRCRNLFDHGILNSKGLIDKYIEYVMEVPNIFQLDRHGNISESETNIGDRFGYLDRSRNLLERDIHAALHQIFTNVRLKSLVEIRGADRTPRGFEMAPVAFWTGLLFDKKVRKELKETLMNWSEKDRRLFNDCALRLDIDQRGPQKRSYGYWIHYFSDYALRGLRNRKLKEEKLFLDFYDIVMKSGPFSLQTQANESTYCS